MPAGVAVLERLGLRGAVGGRPLASVRYHGFGLSAEAGFPIGPDGTAPFALGAAAAAPGRGAARGGAGDAGRARVRGRAGRRRRDRGGARRSACASAASCAAADWWSARTASSRRVRRSLGLDRRGRPGEAGASACACTTASRPGGRSLRAWRSSSAAATSCTRRRFPTASCCSRRSAIATRSGRARAPRWTRWIGEQPLLRDWLDGATPLTTLAGRAPVTRRARAGFAPGRRAAGRRRARHRSR